MNKIVDRLDARVDVIDGVVADVKQILFAGGAVFDGYAVYGELSLLLLQNARNQAQQGGFARAVRANKPENVLLFNGERGNLERQLLVVILLQIFDLNHVLSPLLSLG